MLILNLPPAAHPDILTSKLALEACQIAATAFHLAGWPCHILRADGQPYAPTHLHHPIVRWAAGSPARVTWLLSYAIALQEERIRRRLPITVVLRTAVDGLARHLEVPGALKQTEAWEPAGGAAEYLRAKIDGWVRCGKGGLAVRTGCD
jgi:hypothetical protein